MWTNVSPTGPEAAEMQPNTHVKSATFPVVRWILGRRENTQTLEQSITGSSAYLHKLEQSKYLHMKEVFCSGVIVNSIVVEMNINKRWAGKIPDTF